MSRAPSEEERLTDEQLREMLEDCEDEAGTDHGGTARMYARDAVDVLRELLRLRAFEAAVMEAYEAWVQSAGDSTHEDSAGRMYYALRIVANALADLQRAREDGGG